MAIYHLEAKVISRGAGRSAVAAAAYMSCSQILNDYDGVQHDYTRKQGLVWQQIFLPEYAPAEWSDRGTLWNAVEENEKTKDSRLAREFVVALPIEMGKAEWQNLLTEFIQDNFVADGMCADVCIHDTDGHNPHAHIMVTVRPLDEKGKWQYKTEKEYLCVRDGEEKGFTGAEFKQARREGWEKQYQYKVGRKKEYMPPSAAEAAGYERASKTPKSTRFGRQNPIAARWNSDEQLVLWRSAWANVTNQHMERIGADARIDHRSHADRGLPEQPTVHEGVAARAMERQGFVSDWCGLNRQIKADNTLLRELRKQVAKIAQAVMDTIPAIAEGLESLRQKLLVYRYQFLHFRHCRMEVDDELNQVRPDIRRFEELVVEIKEKIRERKQLTAEKNTVPIWNLVRKHELSQQLAQVTEELEELRSEKAAILARFDRTEDKEMKEVKSWAKQQEKTVQDLKARETHCEEEYDSALDEYQRLSEKGERFDQNELWAERLKHRDAKTQDAREKMQGHFGKAFRAELMRRAEADMKESLPRDECSLWRYLDQKRRKQRETMRPKPKKRDYER